MMNQSKQLIKFLSNYESSEDESLTKNAFTDSDVYAEFTQIYTDSNSDERQLILDFDTNKNLLDSLIPPTPTTRVQSDSARHFLNDTGLYDNLMVIYSENEQIYIQEMKQRLQEKIQRNSIDKTGMENSDGKNGTGNEANKVKTEVINTQTGIKYVAPMRGGHVNQVGRAIAAANSGGSSSKSEVLKLRCT